jgi:hypothetical protein
MPGDAGRYSGILLSLLCKLGICVIVADIMERCFLLLASVGRGADGVLAME